ncbi:uncharacterized protein [Ambystoma mexicanum]|uniref:uncharacterized protein n=1 Tax=Ambystoma mexicanum TaxID=8296 RepID=UPI0037E7C947
MASSNLHSSRHPHDEEDFETLRGPPSELLQSRAVFNIYRRLVQDTETAELQGVLELLRQLEDCQVGKVRKRRLALVKRFLAMDDAHSVLALNPVPKDLGKKLRSEWTNGKISDTSLEEMGSYLRSLLGESFGRFWEDMVEGLEECGIDPSQVRAEGWSQLQPILYAVASKLIRRRLKKRRAKMKHTVRAQPTADDKASLSRSLELAAEGWPTLEMLHFLKYLQTYGPLEELPLLENHLHFCLEVKKFKNAYHDVPDKTLLQKKAWIIRDCFLTSKLDPSLQLAMEEDLLQRTIEAVEKSLNVHTPPPDLFHELHEAVFASLLPFWAGFRKMWTTRSPASAKRPPVLRVQHLLKKRRALFDREEELEKTFHLPPLSEVPRSQKLPRFTYTFSIGKGLALKDDDSTEDAEPDSDGAPGSRKMSEVFQLPPIPEVALA